MFKDDYKNSLNKITVNDEIKEKVLQNIEKNETKKIKFTYKAVAAIAACMVVVLSVVIFRDLSKPQIMTSHVDKTQTYDDVYKVIKNIKIKNSIITFTDSLKGSVNYVEDSLEGDMEMPGGAVDEALTDDVATNTNGASKDHSETNIQVEGVAESDIVLTDGEYIYSIAHGKGHLRIFKAGKEPELLSKTIIKSDLTYDSLYLVGSMYLYEDYPGYRMED